MLQNMMLHAHQVEWTGRERKDSLVTVSHVAYVIVLQQMEGAYLCLKCYLPIIVSMIVSIALTDVPMMCQEQHLNQMNYADL